MKKVLKHLEITAIYLGLIYLTLNLYTHVGWLKTSTSDNLHQFVLSLEMTVLVGAFFYFLGILVWTCVSKIEIDVGCGVDIGIFIGLFVVGHLTLVYLEEIFPNQVSYQPEFRYSVIFGVIILVITGIRTYLTDKYT